MVLRIKTLINELKQAINEDLIELSELRKTHSSDRSAALECQALRQKIDNEVLPALSFFSEELNDVSYIANNDHRVQEILPQSDMLQYDYQEFLQTVQFKLETRDGI